MDLDEQVRSLDDVEAVGLLQRFSRAQPRADAPAALNASVIEQIRNALGLAMEASAADTSNGELARTALLLVASDPDHSAGIQALLEHRPDERFAALETAALVSAVLIALQTHVRFERDKQGKWTVKIEKKSTDATLLKDLVKKLISFG